MDGAISKSAEIRSTISGQDKGKIPQEIIERPRCKSCLQTVSLKNRVETVVLQTTETELNLGFFKRRTATVEHRHSVTPVPSGLVKFLKSLTSRVIATLSAKAMWSIALIGLKKWWPF